MSHSLSILLADDHAMFRCGIRRILQGIDGVKVVGEASDGFELIQLMKKISPQLVILDISMPNLRGLEAMREIKVINPDVKVLILTMHKDEEYLQDAFAAGAEGYLVKDDAETELISALDTLKKGGTYISPLLAPQLGDLLWQKTRPIPGQKSKPEKSLTIREREIIKLIAEGKSAQEVAELLFISRRTVQHHRANIISKLKLKKTADLVRYAIKKGYTASGA